MQLNPAMNNMRLRNMQRRSLNDVAAEVERIVDMPIEGPLSTEDVDLVSQYFVKREAYAAGFRLLPKQAEALCAYNDIGGVFGPIPVGFGKTLTSLLISDCCYRQIIEERMQDRDNPDNRNPRALLLIPSNVLEQLRGSDVAMARKNTIFSCPVHYLSGVPKSKRHTLARSGLRGLYVMTYSILSTKDGEEILDMLRPAIIIADEAHNIAGHKNSARAKRFRRHVDHYAPQVVVLSGTITSKTPMDYHYLAKVSLRNNNFMPNSVSLAEAWSTLIDSTASSLGEFKNEAPPQAGPIKPLVKWAQENFPEEEVPDADLLGFRKAYSLRLQSTPGVVGGSTQDLGVSLLIENNDISQEFKESRPGYGDMQTLIKQLTDQWLTPNGDEIEHAFHLWKWRYEVEGCGFYNELYWPEIDTLKRRRSLSTAAAKALLERSQLYHERQQEYASSLRSWIKNNSRPKLDSPMLIGLSMHKHGSKEVGEALYADWLAMKDADFEGRLDRDSRAVRVCDFKILACLNYVQDFLKKNKGEGIIIWYYHQEIGRWMTEVLQEAGIPAVNARAGKEWNEYLRDSSKLRGQVVCCSITAHSEGKNLQHGFWSSYYLQWPRPAKTAEQSLGRTHRTGQKADTVQAVTCNCSEFDKVTFAATLNDAAYTSQTMNSRQKLLYATYNPVPKRVPWTVLAEWGTDPKALTDQAAGLLDGLGDA